MESREAQKEEKEIGSWGKVGQQMATGNTANPGRWHCNNTTDCHLCCCFADTCGMCHWESATLNVGAEGRGWERGLLVIRVQYQLSSRATMEQQMAPSDCVKLECIPLPFTHWHTESRVPIRLPDTSVACRLNAKKRMTVVLRGGERERQLRIDEETMF